MEDPWGGSAAWGTPAKETKPKAALMEMPKTPPSAAVPIADDPWGAPSAPVASSTVPVDITSTATENTSSPIGSNRPSLEQMHGWSAETVVGGWAAPEPTAPNPSSPQVVPDAFPQIEAVLPGEETYKSTAALEQPVWTLDSPKIEHASELPDDPSISQALSSPSLNRAAPDPVAPTTPISSHPLAVGSPRNSASESPPRAAFDPSPFAGTSMGRSTSFGSGAGSDFGGFSGDFGAGGFASGSGGGGDFGDGSDPWGTSPTAFKADGAGNVPGPSVQAAVGFGGESWGGDVQLPEFGVGSTEEDVEDEVEEDGWGGAKSRNVVARPAPVVDQDWEEAQRRMRLQSERAPPEQVNRLRSDWKELAESWVGLQKLPGLTPEEEAQLEASVRQLIQLNEDNLQSLATIPPDTNTYPPVLSSFTTLHSLVSALAKPNPTPSTSVLHTSAQRVGRRSEQTTVAGSSWTSRSQLGEPDAPHGLDSTASSVAASQGKWSFWGRKGNQEQKQLVTSGGGLLEVKPIAPTPVNAPPLSAERPSMSSRSASIASARPSRPESPAAPGPSAGSGQTPPEDLLSAASPVQSAAQAQPQQPIAGPSRMSRFFGRFRKAEADASESNLDAKDLELNDDDFGYLGQVPSLQQSRGDATGDLLRIGGVPAPAPGLHEALGNGQPPMSSAHNEAPRAPSWSRQSSGSVQPAGRFVAKMKTGPPEMDLLGGMDDTSAVKSTSNAGGGLWDAFMEESPAVPAANPQPPRPSGQPAADDFDDFDDFAPPPPASGSAMRPSSSTTFDDYGDFDSFATSQAGPSTVQQPRQVQSALVQERIPFGQTSKPPPKINHVKKPSLDHDHTRSLLNDAEATKGKRWPAPPSPGVPALEPPPRAPASTGFPFLVPPPPAPTSRPGSTLGRKADFLAFDDPPEAASSSQPATAFASGLRALAAPMTLTSSQGSLSASGPASMQPPTAPAPPSLTATPPPLLQPARIASPIAASQTKASGAPNSGGGKGGLSAQDLSFFDSL